MKRSINSLARTIAEKLNEKNVKDIAGALWFELQKEKRTGQLDYLLEKIREEIAMKNKMKTVRIFSKVGLDEKSLAELKLKLEEKFGSKIEIVNIIDLEVLGGFKIKVGDEVIDYSWREKLNGIITKLVGANG